MKRPNYLGQDRKTALIQKLSKEKSKFLNKETLLKPILIGKAFANLIKQFIFCGNCNKFSENIFNSVIASYWDK